MYYPKLHAEADPAIIDAFIRDNGFATLVSATNNAPAATHLPLELVHAADGSRVLEGHVARANPHWRQLAEGAEIMTIFAGPHTYISPSWYAHENVPTWNYMVVHAWGRARIIEDESEVRSLLRRLSRHYEFELDAMTPGFYAKEVRGIVAFAIALERVEAKFKLSQNRDAADYANVIAKLNARPDEASRRVAAAMTARRRGLTDGGRNATERGGT